MVGERKGQRVYTILSWEPNAVEVLATVVVYKDPVLRSEIELLVVRNLMTC